MKSKINVLIVDDSIMFAEGLQMLLTQHKRIENITLKHTYELTMQYLQSNAVDIVLLDLNFDTVKYDGFVIAKKIKKLYPKIKIMVLTQYAQIDHYETLFDECNVDAYLDKQLSIEETFIAIDKVLKHEKYIDANISKMLTIGRWMDISPREKDVIQLLAEGLTQKEIGVKLFIAARTVENHIRNLCKRHEVKNSVELITKYIRYKSATRENIDDTTAPFKK
ncbi:transcriptional regulatory protein DegU [Kordia sp. SMS9]|uniref:response regulator transcription factor n=1 Tax=Kordia sp. SMS9 TaxID=2282170 RepID=UPI000E0E01A7|nr:response regulator transcription factor [Kordia sp. SMS9]AXG69810.1 transcriptional regulatory protein DegU [Kordia sp. SMS9]